MKNVYYKILGIFIIFTVTYIYAAPPAGYGLVWSDEFNSGTKPDPNIWGYETGCTGYGNAEWQYYTEANATIEDGACVITAKRETASGPWQNCSHPNYTSARMHSKGKKFFKYGYLEVKLKAPRGNGLWPAFWTLGENIDQIGWPACGEMELYEQRTGTWSIAGTVGDNVFIGTCHFRGSSGVSYNSKQYVNNEGLYVNYHLYGILWDSAFVEYYFDDKVYWPRTQTPNINQSFNFEAFHNPHFFIGNIAIMGNYVSSAGIHRLIIVFSHKKCI
jgi:beta-glucanase (GH16 family)